jgi:2-methylcitrate dehydratase PrpD
MPIVPSPSTDDFRFYPAVGTVHAPLDAMRHLRETNALDPRQIKRIRVGLVDFAVGHGAAITRPADAVSAQFSLAFGAGLQFVTGGNAPADYFDPDRWNDAAILAIGDLIEPYAMPIPAGDPVFSARVDIELHDGTHLEHYQAGFRGHPSRPATPADIERKFTGNVAAVLGDKTAAAIIETIRALPECDSVESLTALL